MKRWWKGPGTGALFRPREALGPTGPLFPAVLVSWQRVVPLSPCSCLAHSLWSCRPGVMAPALLGQHPPPLLSGTGSGGLSCFAGWPWESSLWSETPFRTTCLFCAYLQLLTFKIAFKMSSFLICPK